MSQRGLATAAGLSQAVVSRIEAETLAPSLSVLLRLLMAADLWLAVVDKDGRVVQPMEDWDNTFDGAERRYPSHLDTILDPEPREWWADIYGLSRPPETFHRDRDWRDVRRLRSQWEVRVAKYRHAPEPDDPSVWWSTHRKR